MRSWQKKSTTGIRFECYWLPLRYASEGVQRGEGQEVRNGVFLAFPHSYIILRETVELDGSFSTSSRMTINDIVF